VPEHRLAAEELEVRVLHPTRAQCLVGQIVHVLEDQKPGDQPRRQGWLARSRPVQCAKARLQKLPIKLRGQPYQRVPQIDDLLQRRPEQLGQMIVVRPAHRSLPQAKPFRRNHKPTKMRIKNAKNPRHNHRFLANFEYFQRPISPNCRPLQHSSRTTIEAWWLGSSISLDQRDHNPGVGVRVLARHQIRITLKSNKLAVRCYGRGMSLIHPRIHSGKSRDRPNQIPKLGARPFSRNTSITASNSAVFAAIIASLCERVPSNSATRPFKPVMRFIASCFSIVTR
jgi:hypothetical protein